MHKLIILHCVTKINSQSDRVWHAYIDNFALRHKNQFATRNLKSLARLEHSHSDRKWVSVLFPWVEMCGLRWWHDVWHAHVDNFASRHKNLFAMRNLKSFTRFEYSSSDRKWVSVLFLWVEIGELKRSDRVWHACIDRSVSVTKIYSQW